MPKLFLHGSFAFTFGRVCLHSAQGGAQGIYTIPRLCQADTIILLPHGAVVTNDAGFDMLSVGLITNLC